MDRLSYGPQHALRWHCIHTYCTYSGMEGVSLVSQIRFFAQHGSTAAQPWRYLQMNNKNAFNDEIVLFSVTSAYSYLVPTFLPDIVGSYWVEVV
jgi:hypothetical protein